MDTTTASPIAIVGMAGIFPGAKNLDIFWHNLVHKINPVKKVPSDRWIAPPEVMYAKTPTPDKAYSVHMGLVEPFRFDGFGTNLGDDLLNVLDPLYHMVLETGRAVLNGCHPDLVNRNKIGVSLAAIALPTDGATIITRTLYGNSFQASLSGTPPARTVPLNRYQAIGAGVTGSPASILAHAFQLGGGTFTLDAACASSIYAVKLACDELHTRKADLMLAGGVSRPDALFTQVGFSQLRALSPSGRCAPFDETADGLVVGEGAGMLALKRLDDAIRDNDTIFGVIKGIGLSNDTRGNLLAPDSEGQIRAMQKAYDAAQWSPPDVDLIECHGAGTPVGDIVELTSLCRLWEDKNWTPGQCAIGSVKSAIGHLLTGAGAAGMIKTLLGFRHDTLPPSFHFKRPSRNSPLHHSPFRVLTEAVPWPVRAPHTPKRAAVSAFGFGGINGHVLLEEWMEPSSFTGHIKSKPFHIRNDTETKITASVIPNRGQKLRDIPIAVIGMNAAFGTISSLRQFQELVFKGESAIRKRPPERWRGCDELMEEFYRLGNLQGAYMDDLEMAMGEFHIPPNEIPDILPQQLLMLKVAAGAMKDAGITSREKRDDMGAVIGIGFDFETTRFHLRWHLYHQTEQWNKAYGLHLTEAELDEWRAALMAEHGPPLTAVRTIGNLGSIVASRIAREFQFGGPSFAVSNETASGINALEIAVRSLQQKETDAMLVGAVDFYGDACNIATRHIIRPFSPSDAVHPFDVSANGFLPGEGASAVILKRLEDAVSDEDRIYAVIRGIGKASGPMGNLDTDINMENTCLSSLTAACLDADVSPDSITLVETHGSGDPCEDEAEAAALSRFFSGPVDASQKCALGSVKPNIGHTGAAAGLASIVKTVLCLYQEMIPPLLGYAQSSLNWQQNRFHIPISSQYWLKNKNESPRRALAGAMTTEGNCMHVVMEEWSDPPHAVPTAKTTRERKKTTGYMPVGLFSVESTGKAALVEKLDQFLSFLSEPHANTKTPEELARAWCRLNPPDPSKPCAVALVGGDTAQLRQWASEAKSAVLSDSSMSISGSGGYGYATNPIGHNGKIAFVFPGSGNHYVGMGKDIGVLWPEVFRDLEEKTASLKFQMRPQFYMPWRLNWQQGWASQAYKDIVSDPLNMIFGQVVHGCMMTSLISRFGLTPEAVIGYSLGQSTGYFALNAWPDREEMLRRMLKTDLFTTQLAGPCHAARKAWQIPDDEAVNWCVAVINRPADAVRNILPEYTAARLLIANTPTQCIIGGRKPDVTGMIGRLNCEAVFLDGVVTVHCDALTPVASDYRDLHLFPVTPPEGITFYSCAHGKAHELTSQSAADAILEQALEGFDFPNTIQQAYEDGVRFFLEMGPHASCTGMIRTILEDKPHLAVSACFRGENDYLTVLKFLGALLTERLPVNLAALYGDEAYPPDMVNPPSENRDRIITVPVGGKAPSPGFPEIIAPKTVLRENDASPLETDLSIQMNNGRNPEHPFRDLMRTTLEINEAASKTHQTFLQLSSEIEKNYARAFELQNTLLETLITDAPVSTDFSVLKKQNTKDEPAATVAFTRDQCMEFAIGSVAEVMGPEFAVIDTYEKRVRLPDEPLMLVDRILSVEGEKRSLTKGRIITEHDVLPGIWYLDGGKAPVCISVEAGQADLFLCSWLGIDHKVKGKRAYRLLDATVEFHRDLPEPGDTIRYEIEIDKFVRQGETYLFFFHFKGFIKDTPLITMTNGCAGFFTDEEVRNSGGIILSEEEKKPLPVNSSKRFDSPVRFPTKSLSDDQLAALRNGDMAGCFGSDFEGITLAESLRLPGEPMNLIHRILNLDPTGGRYGMGIIRAEADIHPDDWFLTCHFVDDMVMPGTLMYECCAHTLRVFLQQMGWITDTPGAAYEPMMGTKAVLKCRGPVRPDTRHVHYEVEIKEMGYAPEPYVLADAHMYADGHYIVQFKDMSMKLSHVTESELSDFWKKQKATPLHKLKHPLFTRDDLVEFALGKPSKVFGRPYKAFDEDRFIARLPNPPYLFIDDIIQSEPKAWELKPDGWIEARFTVKPAHWYFEANHNPTMPYAVLLEIALQPCGFLAAYMGSALKSEEDLRFRNLGGNAVLYQEVRPEHATLTTRARLKQVSTAGGMIIEQFEFMVMEHASLIFSGHTTFGFFTASSLAQQAGIRDAEKRAYFPSSEELEANTPCVPEVTKPLLPVDALSDNNQNRPHRLAMPAKALLMIDRIDIWLPEGGPAGLGYIKGIKEVDPGEWFFKAHFFQDPVCPGSLGVESFLQLLKFAAIEKWGHGLISSRFEMVAEQEHQWVYRGQIVPENSRVEVEAVITGIKNDPHPFIMADGFLKVDGLYIYEMKNFGIKIV